MENQILADPMVNPENDVIEEALGKKYEIYQKFEMNLLAAEPPPRKRVLGYPIGVTEVNEVRSVRKLLTVWFTTIFLESVTEFQPPQSGGVLNLTANKNYKL